MNYSFRVKSKGKEYLITIRRKTTQLNSISVYSDDFLNVLSNWTSEKFKLKNSTITAKNKARMFTIIHSAIAEFESYMQTNKEIHNTLFRLHADSSHGSKLLDLDTLITMD